MTDSFASGHSYIDGAVAQVGNVTFWIKTRSGFTPSNLLALPKGTSFNIANPAACT